MATTFPGALDNFTNPTGTDTLANPSHSQQHSDLNDAVEAIESEIGADVNSIFHGVARGWLGMAQVSSSTSGITTETDIPSASVTVNVPANRKLKIGIFARLVVVANPDQVILKVYEDSTLVWTAPFWVADAGTDGRTSAAFFVVRAPAAGSRTYKLAAERGGTATSVEVTGSAAAPITVLVEDIGAAS
jgi:hypothetical protein